MLPLLFEVPSTQCFENVGQIWSLERLHGPNVETVICNNISVYQNNISVYQNNISVYQYIYQYQYKSNIYRYQYKSNVHQNKKEAFSKEERSTLNRREKRSLSLGVERKKPVKSRDCRPLLKCWRQRFKQTIRICGMCHHICQSLFLEIWGWVKQR